MAGPKGTFFGCNAELVFVIIMLFTFLFLSIALNYYDNWVLGPVSENKGLGFPAPLVYSLCHCIATLVCSIGLVYGRSGNKITYQMFWGHKIKLVLNSLLLVISITMAGHMVKHASVSVINVLRGCVAVPVLIFAFVFEGKRYSIPKILVILIIVAASIISVPWTTFTYDHEGFWLSISATLCVAAKATVSSMLMKESKRDGMTPLVVLLFDSLFSSLFLMIACMFEGETIRLHQWQPSEPYVVLAGTIFGSLLAFPYNFITYKFIQMTSAMGWAIATSFKLFIVIVVPLIIFDHTTWVGSYVGCAMFLLGITLYAMLEAKYESAWLTDVLPKSMTIAEINKKSDLDGTLAGEKTALNMAQDKLNKLTDAAEAKKWVPKSWLAW